MEDMQRLAVVSQNYLVNIVRLDAVVQIKERLWASTWWGRRCQQGDWLHTVTAQRREQLKKT